MIWIEPGPIPPYIEAVSNQLWQAVLNRDARRDGAFVYAVRSTGVYCRPSCAARRPRRENVVFFPDADAAERAGFRPCRRCTPRQAAPERAMVEAVCRELAAGNTRLAELGRATGVSPGHLQRTFKRLTGVSPRQYADSLRLNGLKQELRSGTPVAAAIYEAGYGGSSRVYENAGAQLGMTPAAYRRGGRGARIGYTVVPCPVGELLVAATERGICAVQLGDAATELEAALRREFPLAEVTREDGSLREAAAAVLHHLAGKTPDARLPLEVRATAFQRRVWEELRAIPRGATRSYSEVARAIGRPGAARAVARACASNPVALLIPCHRVVRDNGDLGGYRWGVRRKQALLEGESADAARKRTE